MTIKNDPVARAVREAYPYQVDLEDCASEPLRHINVVQRYAALVAVNSSTGKVTHASENLAEFTGITWQEALGRPLKNVIPTDVIAQLALGKERDDKFDSINPIQTIFGVGHRRVLSNVIVHDGEDRLILEIETVDEQQQSTTYQKMLARTVSRIQGIGNYDNLFSETARLLQQLTGYDRVLVYRFDREFNGEVIAEALSGTEAAEPFLGLRYPHTDIPPQARELYKKNRVRLINDIGSVPSRLHSVKSEQGPIDLSMVGCRGVSPVHLEYLGYMGVNNSLSVSIIMDGKLWGLFALHHNSPRQTDYGLRNMLLFLGDIFSGHLSLRAASRYREVTLTRNLARLGIGEQISRANDLFSGLTGGNHNLLNFFPNLRGASISFEGREERYGDCPPESDIKQLVEWIVTDKLDDDQLVFHHDSISKDLNTFEHHCAYAAGVMVIFLSPDRSDWICWFRPGISQSITWAGKPDKQEVLSTDGTRRLGPRRSFARYIETVEGCSAPWLADEVDAAFTLRITIINGLMQRYTEVKQINEKLQKAYEDLESFSYTVSHDLRAPLRAISGYGEILEEDYGNLLDEDGRYMLDGIRRGVEQMNAFITDILELSRVGSGGLNLGYVEVAPLARQVASELKQVYATGPVEVHIADNMPAPRADARLLRQLFTNLLSNAFKYAEPDTEGQQIISIDSASDAESDRVTYRVSNTGPAIPQEFVKTIFDMFSRLSHKTAVEGTGVGLAIVERIVNRHGGEVWVTDDQLGVTFNFYLNPTD